MRQIVTTDVTIESVFEVLSRNSRGIALVRDEVTGWVRSMGEYKDGRRGADRQHWQSIWGLAPATVNRKNLPEPLVISRPFVAIAGGLPPDMLEDLSDERGREDGFIHRLLFSFPPEMHSRWTDRGVNPEEIDGYAQLFEGLRKLPVSLVPGQDHIVLQWTGEGRERFVAWAKGHYAEAAVGPPHLRGPWSKMVAHCARFALIIHLARRASEETESHDIDERSVAAAVALAAYFKSHTKKVYRRLRVDPVQRKLSTAIEWIRKRNGHEASVRDLITARVAGSKNNEEAQRLIELLQEEGWGHISTRKPNKGGRTKVVFKLQLKGAG